MLYRHKIKKVTDTRRNKDMAYEEKYRPAELPQNIILEGRKKLSVSGVEDVESFDESIVVIKTVKGPLVIRGNELHMEKLSLDSGDVTIEGSIDSLEYETEEVQSEGFFSRLFR